MAPLAEFTLAGSDVFDGTPTAGEARVAPAKDIPAADAPARVGGVGTFGAGEAPPGGATPTGFEIFFMLWVPVLAAESELDVLRGVAGPEFLEALVAPIETPTGREAPGDVFPEGEAAMLGL